MSSLVVVRVPLRVSFLGGGSDLPLFHENFGRAGCVLSCTINKYVYIVLNIRDNKIIAKYSKTEEVESLDELKNEYVRETLKWVEWKGGIGVHSISNISLTSTGLGGSSAFLVGLLLALRALGASDTSSTRLQGVTSYNLAEEAFTIETGPLAKKIGRQDHYAVSLGGMNRLDFVPSSYPYAGPVIQSPISFPDGLEDMLLMLYTGENSGGNEIFTDIHANKESVLPLYNDLANLARKGVEYAHKGQWEKVFLLMNDAWALKKGTSGLISNPHIDRMHNEIIRAGAASAKLLGAGSGGLMLCYCPNGKYTVLRCLGNKYQDLDFKFTKEGATIILEE